MRVGFHPRAVEDALTIEAWWRENRPAAPDLFRRELEDTVAGVAHSPTLGALSDDDEDFPDVRRARMRRTRYHVYYRVEGDELEVLAIWHAVRREGPKLR